MKLLSTPTTVSASSAAAREREALATLF